MIDPENESNIYGLALILGIYALEVGVEILGMNAYLILLG